MPLTLLAEALTSAASVLEDDCGMSKDRILDAGSPVEMPVVHQQLLFGTGDGDNRVKVLVVGMPGIGSSVMAQALKQLGISKVYATKKLLDPKSTLNTRRLLTILDGSARRHRATFVTAKDFDAILGDCNAVVDLPAAAYATDLMIAYRGAKVILTTLPPAAQKVWVQKLQFVFNELHNCRLIKFLLRTNVGNYRATHKLLTTIGDGFFDGDISQHAIMSYKIHEGRIKGTLNLQRRDEATDLLKFDPSTDGWEPLCKFLGLPVPKNTPFPQPANADDIIDIADFAAWRLFIRYTDHHWYLTAALSVLPATLFKSCLTYEATVIGLATAAYCIYYAALFQTPEKVLLILATQSATICLWAWPFQRVTLASTGHGTLAFICAAMLTMSVVKPALLWLAQ